MVPSHQLVLQFAGDSLDDFDELVALEDRLIECLGDVALVDGHDIGSGERNIFILCSDLNGVFALLEPVLAQARVLDTVVVASRPIDREEYAVIWPVGYNAAFHIA